MKIKYTAQNTQGRLVKSIAVDKSVPSLLARLKTEGLLPIKAAEIKTSTAQLKKKLLFFKNRVSNKEVAIFTRQLSATLNAGLLLTEALDTIAEDFENEHFQGIIKKIVEDIRGGSNFSESLVKYPKIFPKIYVAIVKSGEATGNLNKTLSNLAKYLEDSERLREKVKTAITYPAFVFGFAWFVVFVIVVFLIPKFKGLFTSAKAELPLLTKIVVAISEFALNNMLLALVGSILIGFICWYLLKFPKVRYTVDIWKLKIPILGKDVIQKAIIARYCRTFGVLLSGGVSMAIALDIVRDVVDHGPTREAVGKIREQVLGGRPLSAEIRAQKIFPRLVSKMVSVGERTGHIDEMLEKTATYYEDELENTLQKLTSLLEPVLIVFVGGIVLLVVLALYLPIFKISSAIR